MRDILEKLVGNGKTATNGTVLGAGVIVPMLQGYLESKGINFTSEDAMKVLAGVFVIVGIVAKVRRSQ